MVALAQQLNTSQQPVNEVIHGDCLAVLKTLESNSVDSIVTDPPAGINFMNMKFDSDKGGRDAWVAWLQEIMTEALRVLKPGGHALVWSLPRTSHWTAYALENSGFTIKDSLAHIFGSGFPKSMDISKAIDRMQGAEREKVKTPVSHGTKAYVMANETDNPRPWIKKAAEIGYHEHAGDMPATPEASQWAGWGSALKPSHETWILARKPLSEPTIAANVLKWGCGGLNIDASRIGISEEDRSIINNRSGKGQSTDGWGHIGNRAEGEKYTSHNLGRFPSNLLLSHSLLCQHVGVKKVPSNRWGKGNERHGTDGVSLFFGEHAKHSGTGYEDSEGMETIDEYICDASCPVRILGEQSGKRSMGHFPKSASNGGIWGNGKYPTLSDKSNNGYEDEGTAARYFQQFTPSAEDDALPVPFIYQSKPSRRERNAGCEELPEQQDHTTMSGAHINKPDYACSDGVHRTGIRQPTHNHHPTVKSTTLMSYLIRLITPPNGIVLDCFAGSGSTLVACIHSGFNFIGIEQSDEYIQIARARIAHAWQEHDALLNLWEVQ